MQINYKTTPHQSRKKKESNYAKIKTFQHMTLKYCRNITNQTKYQGYRKIGQRYPCKSIMKTESNYAKRINHLSCKTCAVGST